MYIFKRKSAKQIQAEKWQEDSLCLGRLGSLGNVLAAAFVVCCAIGGISYQRAEIVGMYRTTEFEMQKMTFPKLTSATFLLMCISETERQRFTVKRNKLIKNIHVHPISASTECF